MIYPLIICYIAIENGPVEIDNLVSFPIENGDFPSFFGCLPGRFFFVILGESHPPDFSRSHVMVWMNSHTGINGLACGKIGTGNHRFSHVFPMKIMGFPVTFP